MVKELHYVKTPKVQRSVQKIVVLRAEGNGEISSTVVYRKKDKQKKQSKGLRVFEKLARYQADASRTFGDTYLKKHERSNRRRRDGWLQELGKNLVGAGTQARRKIKLTKLLGW